MSCWGISMPVLKPYKRTVRQLTDGSYSYSGNSRYISHPDYAKASGHFIRAFQIVQKDLLELFDYVEPSKENCGCYSHRILELFARCCFELEANFKAILSENGYAAAGSWTMADYSKVNISHRLSSYEVKMPVWEGEGQVRRPFSAWAANEKLPWYAAYNDVKHSRHANFGQANFGNLTDAVCGLVALVSAQFLNMDGGPPVLSLGDEQADGFEYASGGYFLVKYPDDWAQEDRYSFDWCHQLSHEPNPIQSFNY